MLLLSMRNIPEMGLSFLKLLHEKRSMVRKSNIDVLIMAIGLFGYNWNSDIDQNVKKQSYGESNPLGIIGQFFIFFHVKPQHCLITHNDKNGCQTYDVHKFSNGHRRCFGYVSCQHIIICSSCEQCAHSDSQLIRLLCIK